MFVFNLNQVINQCDKRVNQNEFQLFDHIDLDRYKLDEKRSEIIILKMLICNENSVTVRKY